MTLLSPPISPVNCTDPGIPDNAQRMGSDFLYQDEVVFTCNHGYYQSSGPEGGVRTCLETGLWSDVQPECSCEFASIRYERVLCRVIFVLPYSCVIKCMRLYLHRKKTCA